MMQIQDLATMPEEDFLQWIKDELNPQEAMRILSEIGQYFKGPDQASILMKRMAKLTCVILVASMNVADQSMHDIRMMDEGMEV